VLVESVWVTSGMEALGHALLCHENLKIGSRFSNKMQNMLFVYFDVYDKEKNI
jgi:hypothetical protein